MPSNIPTKENYEILFEDDVPTLAAGNWNAKHKDCNNEGNCANGNAIAEIAQKLNLEINGPMSPTHRPTNRGLESRIDFPIFRDLNMYYDLYTLSALGSDHDPVIIELHTTHIPALPDPQIVNWDYFTEIISHRYLPAFRVSNRPSME